VDFPCCIGIIGNWTRRKSRGIVSGAWATCSPIGNIIGLQISVVILNKQGNHWEYQMYYVTLGYLVVAALFFTFLKASPAEIGVQLESEAVVDEVLKEDHY